MCFCCKCGLFDWFFSIFRRKENNIGNKDWIPNLTDEEISSIKDESAKFIYDNAIETLLNIDKSIENIMEKSDTLFKLLFVIQSAIVIFFIKDLSRIALLIKSGNIYIFASIISFIILLSCPSIIYLYGVIYPKAIKGNANPPENTFTKRALKDMKICYLCESIEIQRYAIPFNNNNLQQRANSLRYLIASGILFLIYSLLLFCSFAII